jgi:putative colanic acid biosynthesis UDP-glucose lipid carrier transferase
MTPNPTTTNTTRFRGPMPAGLAALTDPIILALAYGMSMILLSRSPGMSDVTAVLAILLLAYPGRVPFAHFDPAVIGRLLLAWLLPVSAVGVFALLSPLPLAEQSLQVDRDVWALWAFLSLAGIGGLHATAPVVLRAAQRAARTRSAVVIGADRTGVQFGTLLARGGAAAGRMAGYFDDRCASRLDPAARSDLRGSFADVGTYVNTHCICAVYIALPMRLGARLEGVLEQLRDTTACVYFIPDAGAGESQPEHARVAVVSGASVLAVCDTPIRGSRAAAKRALDLVVTVTALPLLLPVMAVVAIAICATSPGPALFRQKRYGLHGQEIQVWKFRTMVDVEDGTSRFRAAERDDARITPVGRFLRRTSLDELPQFINVLGGSMSIVGPRPHAVAMNENLRRQIPGYMQRHMVRPGITGWAQVNGLRGGDTLDAIRKRTEYDLQYLRSWTLALDLAIMARTVIVLAMGDPKAH